MMAKVFEFARAQVFKSPMIEPEQAVFMPANGQQCAINIIIDYQGQSVPVGFDNYAIGPRETIFNVDRSALYPQVPAQNDLISHDGTSYRITDVDQDGYEYFLTVIVEDA